MNTPGPWETRWATNHYDGQPHAVVDANGFVVADVVRTNRQRGPDTGDDYANARMIAACPDLFTALTGWLAIFERESAYVSPLVATALIETRKATGETT